MTRAEALEKVAEAARQYSRRLIARTSYDGELHRKLVDELDALDAAPDDGWRPIETAPKNGFFLGWNGQDESWEIWSAVNFWIAQCVTAPPVIRAALSEEAKSTTHWRPLPPPPAPGRRTHPVRRPGRARAR